MISYEPSFGTILSSAIEVKLIKIKDKDKDKNSSSGDSKDDNGNGGCNGNSNGNSNGNGGCNSNGDGNKDGNVDGDRGDRGADEEKGGGDPSDGGISASDTATINNEKTSETSEGRIHIVTATFTPYNDIEYEPTVMVMRLLVKRCELSIYWPTLKPMLKNFGLSEVQQNAEVQYPEGTSSRVRSHCKVHELGILVYNPAAGTVFHAGEEELSVTFTPYEKWKTLFSITGQRTLLDVVRPEPAIYWEEPGK